MKTITYYELMTTIPLTGALRLIGLKASYRRNHHRPYEIRRSQGPGQRKRKGRVLAEGTKAQIADWLMVNGYVTAESPEP